MLSTNNLKYLGFGSPIMDMICDVTESQIEKYDLELDRTKHVSMKTCLAFESVEKEATIKYLPGGCSYNTMRVFNQIINSQESNGELTGLLGSVGFDRYGDMYNDVLEEEKIVPLFEKIEDNNTGVCLVFCNKRERGHLTDLGASTLVSESYTKQIWDHLKNVELIFTELFILKHQKKVVYMLAELSDVPTKRFGFNLPSLYFIETFKEDIIKLTSYADIIFANRDEVEFFGKMLFKDDFKNLTELCERIAGLPKKLHSKKRVVVITSGPFPAHVAEYDFDLNKITFSASFTPDFVDEDKIIDSNGAGDAFAGGFMSQWIRGKDLENCAQMGHKAAGVVIQEQGFKLTKIV